MTHRMMRGAWRTRKESNTTLCTDGCFLIPSSLLIHSLITVIVIRRIMSKIIRAMNNQRGTASYITVSVTLLDIMDGYTFWLQAN